MFPGGEPGWHPNVLKVDGGKRNGGRRHNLETSNPRNSAPYLSFDDNYLGKFYI